MNELKSGEGHPRRYVVTFVVNGQGGGLQSLEEAG